MSVSLVPTSCPVADEARASAESLAGNAPRVVESKALFGPAREVRIVHDGHEYRLRVTRLGKLLLTK